MKCHRARQLIFDFLDGTIADSDRVVLERHLGECKSCEAFASSIARSLDLLHRAPVEEPSENFNWKVKLRLSKEKNAIREEIAAQRAAFKSWNLRFALSALSAFVLVIASGYLLWTSGILVQQGEPAYQYSETSMKSDRAPGRSVPSVTRPRSTGRIEGVPSTGPNLVVSGENGGFPYHSFEEPIEREGTLLEDPDSLMVEAIRSVLMQRRIRDLEDHVELLQRMLRECEGEKAQPAR
jgi:hypothetical protein